MIKDWLALPQRIRAGCDFFEFVNICDNVPLPQRIRAGCDGLSGYFALLCLLCHSAFVRVATSCTLRPRA